MSGRDRTVEAGTVPVPQLEELTDPDRDAVGSGRHSSMPAGLPATPRMMWTRKNGESVPEGRPRSGGHGGSHR